MERMFFVIHTSEDGDVSLQSYSEAALTKALNKQDWGDTPVVQPSGPYYDLRTREGLIIIEGKLVTPRPEKVVETWRL